MIGQASSILLIYYNKIIHQNEKNSLFKLSFIRNMYTTMFIVVLNTYNDRIPDEVLAYNHVFYLFTGCQKAVQVAT